MDIIIAEELSSVVLGGVGVTIILLCSLPSLLNQQSSKRTGAIALTDLYKDEDGTATKESEEAFEKASWLPTYIFYVGTVLGLATGIATAVYSTLGYLTSSHATSGFVVNCWLDVAAWVSCQPCDKLNIC